MCMKLTDIQNILGTSKILTCFSGRFSQGLIEEMGEAVKKHMECEEMPKNAIFNVFSIFIEQTQNIKNYTATKEGSPNYNTIAGNSIVCIGNTENNYFIWSGNYIENSDIEPLRKKLELVSKANKDELKLLFREQMKKELEPGKNGAGIGLIDIARKASSPIEYSFEKVDDSFYFYEIKVIV
ncbi:MAG: SiaB family protein kinase [Bacillota bacterium]|nr:SiaB family protein kinase [Bacillota bacterium]